MIFSFEETASTESKENLQQSRYFWICWSREQKSVRAMTWLLNFSFFGQGRGGPGPSRGATRGLGGASRAACAGEEEEEDARRRRGGIPSDCV